jgi:hypothetical protein
MAVGASKDFFCYYVHIHIANGQEPHCVNQVPSAPLLSQFRMTIWISYFP